MWSGHCCWERRFNKPVFLSAGSGIKSWLIYRSYLQSWLPIESGTKRDELTFQFATCRPVFSDNEIQPVPWFSFPHINDTNVRNSPTEANRPQAETHKREITCGILHLGSRGQPRSAHWAKGEQEWTISLEWQEDTGKNYQSPDNYILKKLENTQIRRYGVAHLRCA